MSAPKPILVLPANATKQVCAQARAAGYLVILTDKPEAVRVVGMETLVSSGDLVMSLLEGICGASSYTERTKFALELHRRMKLRESAQP